MNVIFVRHGQCIANLKDLVAGSNDDSPLTELGIQQAQVTARQLQDRSIDRIVSSQLIRAQRTAEIIRDIVAPKLTIDVTRDFCERGIGDALGLTREAYFKLEDSHTIIPNAETEAQLHDRVNHGLAQLRERPVGTTLVVTHNGTFRMIECILQNRPASDYPTMPGLQNAEIKELAL